MSSSRAYPTPKKYISYTPVEALLRVNLFSSYDYEFSVFGGLRLHALEFDSKKDSEYKDKYGKGMADGYSYGFTAGLSGAKYFGRNDVTPKLFGIGARAGFANFGESRLDIEGFNWYVGIDLRCRFSTDYKP